MQIGGERLGRAGIEVAGMERRVDVRPERVIQGKGYGGQRHGGDYEGTAGEVRQGSEAKGNAGRVEVRQARKVGVEFGKDDTESRGTAGTESSGGLWSGLESPVLDRSGQAGEERLGEVGCGLQRQDAAG